MSADKEFDIVAELENAVELQFAEFELPLIDTLRPVGFDDGRGGLYYPSIWAMTEQFVPGYLTEWRTAVAFLDWSRPTPEEAMEVAKRFTGLSSEHARGLR